MGTGQAHVRRPSLLLGGANKSNTLSEKVRGPHEKCSAVSLKARFMLVRERTESVIIEIVVVTDVERRSGMRVPTEKKLSAHVST